MAYLKEYAQELVEAEGSQAPDTEATREGLKAAIGHVDEYLQERTGVLKRKAK